MRFEVLLTEDAFRDLEDISSYVVEHDSLGKAEDLLNRIADVVDNLSNYPHRALTQRNFRHWGFVNTGNYSSNPIESSTASSRNECTST